MNLACGIGALCCAMIEDTHTQRLLPRIRHLLRMRRYSRRTEDVYLGWVRRFIEFHGRRHPKEMGEAEVSAFLSSLATEGGVSAGTQNQALAALLFMYRHVLGVPIAMGRDVVRAKRPRRVPVIMTQDEVWRVLNELNDACRVAAVLMYGSGLRLMECLTLRVKDVDSGHEITVRGGKGNRDRCLAPPIADDDPVHDWNKQVVQPLRLRPLFKGDVDGAAHSAEQLDDGTACVGTTLRAIT